MKPWLILNHYEKIVLAGATGAGVLVWLILGATLVGIYGWNGVACSGVTPGTAHAAAPTIVTAQIGEPQPTLTGTPTSIANTPAAPAPTDTPLPPTSTPSPTTQTAGAPAIPLGDDTVVIVLLGIDEKPDAGVWRTDSLILAFVQMDTKRISLLSIPRDLWVYIPGYGYNRINTVDALGERTNYPGGGHALLDKTLQYNLGVSLDHYIRVDFQGFVDIVNALGGVTVYVEKPITDQFPDPLSESGMSRITLTVGAHRMDGHTALMYCRSRLTTDDFDRSRRQQQVLKGLWQQTFTPKNLAQAPKLWQTLNTAFETDLSMVDAILLASYFQGVDPQNVRSKSLGYKTATPWTTSQGAQVLLPQTKAIQQLIVELLAAPRPDN